jgi:hypothetical protein
MPSNDRVSAAGEVPGGPVVGAQPLESLSCWAPTRSKISSTSCASAAGVLAPACNRAPPWNPAPVTVNPGSPIGGGLLDVDGGLSVDGLLRNNAIMNERPSYIRSRSLPEQRRTHTVVVVLRSLGAAVKSEAHAVVALGQLLDVAKLHVGLPEVVVGLLVHPVSPRPLCHTRGLKLGDVE